MPLLLADFIYSRDCKPNLRKNVDTTGENIAMFMVFQYNKNGKIRSFRRKEWLR